MKQGNWPSLLLNERHLQSAWLKKAINTGSDMELEKALNLEKTLITSCFDTEDRVEGMKAFLEKREPDFKGK